MGNGENYKTRTESRNEDAKMGRYITAKMVYFLTALILKGTVVFISL